MFVTAICNEKYVTVYEYNGINIEIVKCPATIWCGVMGYASDVSGEPDIDVLLKRYQDICYVAKKELAMKQWSCCISIDYWKNGAVPRGIMFAQQVHTDEQEAVYDIFRMPETMFARVRVNGETAMAAFGRESCEVYELFGVIRESLTENGYVIADNGAQEIEMYDHEDGLFYAYVPIMDV